MRTYKDCILLEGKNLNKGNIRLTSTEITNLLTQYEQETMSICIDKYVLATVQDPEVRSLFEFAMGLSEKHVKKIKEFLKKENFPVPNGFTEKDVKYLAGLGFDALAEIVSGLECLVGDQSAVGILEIGREEVLDLVPEGFRCAGDRPIGNQ